MLRHEYVGLKETLHCAALNGIEAAKGDSHKELEAWVETCGHRRCETKQVRLEYIAVTRMEQRPEEYIFEFTTFNAEGKTVRYMEMYLIHNNRSQRSFGATTQKDIACLLIVAEMLRR